MKHTIQLKMLFHYGVFGFVLLAMAVSALSAEPMARMSKEDLKAILDDPETLVLDVRSGWDWTSSAFKIKGALRAPPEDFSQWAEQYPKGKTIVLYCA